jgi:Domain of unknown function (DUF6265)
MDMQLMTAPILRMRAAAPAAVLLPLLLCGPAALAAGCAPGAVSWMAGRWQDAANPKGSREQWSIAPGGVLMGSGWSFPGDGKGGFAEIMTVRPEGETLKMVLRHFDVALGRAWEEREAPMEFVASQCSARSAVFEGSGARAGERLTYEVTAGGLDITGDFLHQGKPVQVKWHMLRSAD